MMLIQSRSRYFTLNLNGDRPGQAPVLTQRYPVMQPCEIPAPKSQSNSSSLGLKRNTG